MTRAVTFVTACIGVVCIAATPAAAQQHRRADHAPNSHAFTVLADGGIIELQGGAEHAEAVAHIREHLLQLALAFQTGEDGSPALAQLQCVPGASEMIARRAAITYVYTELPAGAALRVVTTHPEAVRAVHAFLSFHKEHHVTEHEQHGARAHGAAHSRSSRHGAAQELQQPGCTAHRGGV